MTFIGGAMILLLLAWESYRNLGYERSEDELKMLRRLSTILVVAYSVAQYVKKGKMLDTA